MTPNYEVDFNDERLTSIKTEENAELSELEKAYGQRIDESNQHYQDLADKTQEWADTQSQLQKEQTDLAIEQIEQDKEQTQKEYTKEQSGAYVDWQKQSAKYGVNAEQMASMGMSGTGYSESSQVSMYNTYQNRIAAARETFKQIVSDYNISIAQARLQNSSILAEIAAEAQKQRLEYLLQGTIYKNQLLSEMAAEKSAVKQRYSDKWQIVLNQINTEKAAKQAQENWQKEYDLAKEQLDWEKKPVENQAGTIIDDGEGENPAGNDRVLSTPNSSAKQIKTKYYSGPIAQNVGGFGYMGKDDNGVAYQPKGIFIYGKAYKLEKSGKTAKQMFGKGSVNSSGVNIDNQNVWTANGQYFIWNGTRNQYERVG